MNKDENASPGRFKEITSPANPLIRELKTLTQKKHRDAKGLFVAEGQKLVFDALGNAQNDAEAWQAQTLVFSKSLLTNENVMALAARARTGGSDILVVPEKLLASISRRDNPQMVLGVFKQRFKPAKTFESLLSGPGDIIVALDRVRDPGNLGTIIRTADGVGAKAIILIGQTTDPFSLEAVRASMGSIFNMSLGKMNEDEFIAWAKQSKAALMGTHLKGETDFREFDYDAGPAILLMGNEQQGLSDNLTKACDKKLFMPMFTRTQNKTGGNADSFNLAIATGIMLYQMRRNFLKMPI